MEQQRTDLYCTLLEHTRTQSPQQLDSTEIGQISCFLVTIPIRLVGCSVVSIRIGDETLDHPIHFTETQCIPSQAHSYNIILDPHPPKELVVRSAQTMVLPPGTETLVPCYVAQVPPSNPPLMASASVLDEDNIFVAPRRRGGAPPSN
ncbi:unnamed protein product [Nippostrongylus brasiliensis]|uniref:Arrestin_C domain-containing protein n=1 Tax=Nippostrongylus brasiliensis TaxID=27835 RepID=A0A0N4YY46_NIPBR|nr:unnamed protein product [Nippostrongylus brasiliensis]